MRRFKEPCEVACIKASRRITPEQKPPRLTSSAFLAQQDAVLLQPTLEYDEKGKDGGEVFLFQCFALQYSNYSVYHNIV